LSTEVAPLLQSNSEEIKRISFVQHPQITQELFHTYGAITPQTVAAAKAEVEAETYNHARPMIVNIFTVPSMTTPTRQKQ
jgi:hypothetical protein